MEKEMFEVGLVVLILVDHLKLYQICFFDFYEEKISSVKSELLRGRVTEIYSESCYRISVFVRKDLQ
jgi:hypothetical protein